MVKTDSRGTKAVPARPRPLVGLVGTVLLVAILGFATVLSLAHVPGVEPVGCGAGGGCAKLKQSAYGVAPGTAGLLTKGEGPLYTESGWPTAYLGLGYFAAVFVVWLVALAKGLHPVVYWLARLGALASAGYLVVMVVERALCPWCLAVHLSNFALLGVLEYNRVTSRRAMPDDAPADEDVAPTTLGLSPTLLIGVVTFVLVTAAAGAVHNAAARAELDAAEESGIDALLNPPAEEGVDETGDGSGGEGAGDSAGGDGGEAGGGEPAPAVEVDLELPAEAHGPERPGTGGFTGRYLLGPQQARVRVVMFTNPICPFCRTVEREIVDLVERREDVSLSVKQYPLNGACNPLGGAMSHPGSCEAAYYQEAAGLLGGADAFWAMSLWLYQHFESAGVLSQRTLFEKVAELGLDVEEFRAAVNSEEVRSRVRSDVDEGVAIGITQTPTLFLNGQMFMGWSVPGATSRAIEGAIARAGERLPPRTSALDPQPERTETLYRRWIARPVQEVGLASGRPTFGPGLASVEAETAPAVRVVVFLDYTNERSREVDRRLRTSLAQGEDFAYQPRVFPMDEACNFFADVEGGGRECEAARAVMTAQELGGFSAFSAMHDMLIRAEGEFGEAEIRAAFESAGVDADAAMERMGSDEIRQAVLADAAQHARAQPRFRAPAVYLNGRLVQFWSLRDDFLLDDFIERVREEMRVRPELFEPRG